MDTRILRLIATIIEVCDPPREGACGHPPTETVRVLRTLRRFLREGTPWRSLTATDAQASGSTLRRWLTRWAETGLLAQVHLHPMALTRADGSHPENSAWTSGPVRTGFFEAFMRGKLSLW